MTSDTPNPDRRGKPKVAISACLMGRPIRFDGGHKQNRFVCHDLAEHFELIPVCPEMAIGLGVPRKPIRLVDDPALGSGIRVVRSDDSSIDVTDRLVDYGTETAARLSDISGYILKSQSPTCGMERVKVYQAGGGARKDGVGAFVQGLREANPILPLEEEGRLNDAWLREQFIERVYAHHEWLGICENNPSTAALMDFHKRHKLLLRSHDAEACRRLGRLLAEQGKQMPADELALNYMEGFMAALGKQSRNRRHASVMERLVGRLRHHIDADDRSELLAAIKEFRGGMTPMLVPLTLLRHHINRRDNARGHQDVAEQRYLSPHPIELRLRRQL